MSGNARTRWGWHQLTDHWARHVVRAANVGPGDLVLDVGAGLGALTAPLVDVGARVIAIELHAQRARHLRHRFATASVKVVQVDASDLRLPRRPFRVVANPPFSITTALIKRLLSSGSQLTRADLVVPRHVARRWASDRAPGIGRWGAIFQASIEDTVPAKAFRPPPTAATAILCIRRRAITRRATAKASTRRR